MFSHSRNNKKEELISLFENRYNVKFDEQLHWKELHEFNCADANPNRVTDAWIKGSLLIGDESAITGLIALRAYRMYGRKVVEKMILWRNSPCLISSYDSELSLEQLGFMRGVGSRLSDNRVSEENSKMMWFLNHPSA